MSSSTRSSLVTAAFAVSLLSAFNIQTRAQWLNYPKASLSRRCLS